MAHTPSALKRIRSSERRHKRNTVIRSRVKSLIRRARQQIDVGHLEQARLAVGDAISALDKAAEKGVLHKNNAARRKSRLMKYYNAAFSPASASE
ncbi:MAG: 30S ribosomal protein S20 [Chloroflexia bacterium]|nr:30S ribosomal protein S20 [Chloroflexia bacterium]